MRITIFFILFFSIQVPAFSQKSKLKKSNEGKIDTAYVKEFNRYVSLENSIARNGLNVLIEEKGSGKIRYAINEKTQIGFRVNWRFVNLGFGISLPAINNDDDKYGKTTGFNFFISSQIKRKISLDVYFSTQKGMYIANPSKLIPNFNTNGPYPSYGTMSVNHLGIDASYIFNHKKYSLKAPLNINERQIKSSGSFFAGGYFFFSQIHDDLGVLHDSLANSFKTLQATNDISSFNIGVSGGYGYNLVIRKHGLISMTGQAGIGPGFSTIRKEDESLASKAVLSGRFKLRVVAAYMNNSISTGVRASLDVLPNSANDNTRINYETDHVALFFSYRFLPKMTQRKMSEQEKF